jgi:hypothetical protein
MYTQEPDPQKQRELADRKRREERRRQIEQRQTEEQQQQAEQRRLAQARARKALQQQSSQPERDRPNHQFQGDNTPHKQPATPTPPQGAAERTSEYPDSQRTETEPHPLTPKEQAPREEQETEHQRQRFYAQERERGIHHPCDPQTPFSEMFTSKISRTEAEKYLASGQIHPEFGNLFAYADYQEAHPELPWPLPQEHQEQALAERQAKGLTINQSATP